VINACTFLVGTCERKITLARTPGTWKDNIKEDLDQTGYEGVTCIPVAVALEHSNELSVSIMGGFNR
jgi:hypothetical protein